MDIRSVILVSWRALARNKMRSALSMLGITIGICAVICTIAIGQGGSQQIQEQLLSLGDNLVWIEAGGRNVNGVRTGNGETKSLTLDDAAAIQGSIPLVKMVSPNVDDRIQVIYGNHNWSTSYRGVGPEYLSIRRWTISSGVPFTTQDVQALANVCLIGQTIVDQLFGEENPLGKTIRMNSLPVPVIGVLEAKGLSATGNDQDDVVFMPYSTAQHKIKGIDWLDDIWCSAISPEAVIPAQDRIALLLRQRHHLRPDEPDDFNIRHPTDILQAQQQASETFSLMLASIASVSLLVGGIGIMNIMLVSITERTREIGVRMAVGATERDVRLQFLSEALALSLLGGAFGVLAGVLASLGFSVILEWPMTISTTALVAAVLFSIAIGVFFGFYPAYKASRLDPIEALRYE
jgi:putative ABC transport system permease protein